MAPSTCITGGMPSAWRSWRSPLEHAEEQRPEPGASAASSIVITDIDASTVQYGAGHASGPAPSPVAFLSGSE